MFKNERKPESPQSKDTFIPTICPIKTGTLAMMDAGCCQMTYPPDGDEESEQESMQALFVFNRAGFQIPAATLGILKGCFDPHTSGIFVQTGLACWSVRNHDPSFFMTFGPTGADLGRETLLLPDRRRSIPLVSRLFDQAADGFPVTPTLACGCAKRVFAAHPQEIMPAAIPAPLHHRHTRQATISHQGTLRRFSHTALHHVQQSSDDTPLSFFPFFLPWHHC